MAPSQVMRRVTMTWIQRSSAAATILSVQQGLGPAGGGG